MAVTTSTTLTAINSYLDRKSLKRATDALIYADGPWVTKITIPQKNSAVYKARRYNSIAPTGGTQAASLKAVVEGAIPTNVQPTITDITATCSQYGSWFEFTDVATWTNEVDVNQNLMKVNAENMARTLDFVVRDNIMAGTNVFRLTDDVGGVSGAARVNVAGHINAVALDKAIRDLEEGNAERVTPAINAGSGEGTSAVRAGYVALIHPHVKYDLEQVPGYKSVVDYGSTSGLLKNEVGSYKDIRFVMSTGAKIFADSGATKAATQSTTGTDSDVYATVILGKDAYAAIELASTQEVIYKPLGQGGNDPLNQRATIGWKAMSTALILNDAFMLRFESVATA